MGFSYLNNQDWGDISREERLYCAYLFESVRKDTKKLLDLIRSKLELGKAEYNAEWEIGYEVCFYRDYFYAIKKRPIRSSGFSPKRTFDLCLFSEKRIIIFESKVHQGFESRQIGSYKKDKGQIHGLLRKTIKVDLVAICSGYYHSKLLSRFDATVTWEDLHRKYRNPIFDQANSIYITGRKKR